MSLPIGTQPLRQVVPDLDQLLANPAAYLAERPIAIAKAKPSVFATVQAAFQHCDLLLFALGIFLCYRHRNEGGFWLVAGWASVVKPQSRNYDVTPNATSPVLWLVNHLISGVSFSVLTPYTHIRGLIDQSNYIHVLSLVGHVHGYRYTSLRVTSDSDTIM